MNMNIKKIKAIALEYFLISKNFLIDYCLNKTTLITALFSFFFSALVLYNSSPIFYITSSLIPVNQQMTKQSEGSAALSKIFNSGVINTGVDKSTQFAASVRSSDTAKMLWDEWGLELFNSDPDNKDPNKMIREHKLLDKLMSRIGGYELPRFYTYYDLQKYIQSSVKIDTDIYGYELLVSMFSSNKDFAINFLDDVIRASDLVAKKYEIKKARAKISALTRDLASLKNSSMTSAFSERINSEYFKIASLDNDLPYFISVLDPPRSSPYPISPNILFIILSNLIIFIFIGVSIEFFRKNKDDLW